MGFTMDTFLTIVGGIVSQAMGFAIPALLAYCFAIHQTTKAKKSDFLHQIIHDAHDFKEACLQVWTYRDQSCSLTEEQRINHQSDALARMNNLIGTLMAHEAVTVMCFPKRDEPLRTALQRLRCFRFDGRHWNEWFADLDSRLDAVKEEAAKLWIRNAAILPQAINETFEEVKSRYNVHKEEWKKVSPAS